MSCVLDLMLIIEKHCMKKIIIFWLILFSNSLLADMSFRSPSDEINHAFVWITGTISKSDAEILEAYTNSRLKRFGKLPSYSVMLNSTGGSVAAAMEIGKILRKTESLAQVEERAVCLSACPYILAGATSRGVYGIVGVHRLYEPEAQQLSPAEQKKKYKLLAANIYTYLDEVNISRQLYDDAIYINPEDIKILTKRELQVYGLSENDPYQSEYDASKTAKKNNISRKEQAAREAKAKIACPLPATTEKDVFMPYVKCKERILSGAD